jgi:predicted phage terminase large subunit-like protein
MILPEYNTKIMGRSVGQSSRGLRFREDRPELAVFDDLESDDSVRTQEKRDKTENWFKGVMMPALDENRKVILSGSLLHQDCLMRRIEQEIENNKRDGRLLKFPFFDKKGEPTWKTKFDSPEKIQAEKRLVGKESMWQREYLLNIVPEEGQIITYEDINWYEKIPERAVDKRRVIAVDLAISEKETADYTAITVFHLATVDGNVKIYCEDYSNKRTGFKDTLEDIDKMHSKYPDSVVLIEDKSYQRAAIETLENERSYPVKPISFKGDKRSRLETISPLIKKGMVYFKESQREIVEQMVNLGTEKHDDLCDSAVYALYDLQRHLNNTSFPTKDEEEDTKPITSGLLGKQF